MKFAFCLCLILNGIFDGLCLPVVLTVGSECHNDNQLEGTCTLKPDCPKAEEDVEKYGYHNLTRCGFEKLTEIVCCPIGASIRSPVFLKSRSETACTNYTMSINSNLEPQISGGKNASLGEFPYMGALGLYSKEHKHYKFSCGGTLISDKFVLTAAHCIVNLEGDEVKVVRLGTINAPPVVETLNGETDYNVKQYTLHPEFKRKSGYNDIAVIELEKPVKFGDYLRPACLFTKKDEFPIDYIITGWGAMDNNGKRTPILQKGAVSFVSLETCKDRYKASYSRILQDNHLCAVHLVQDTCQGDSGGPLLKQNSTIPILVGVTSHGAPGCGSGFPSVYASVVNYIKWIEDIVWP